MRSNSDPAPFLFIGFAFGVWTFFKGFRIMREYKVLDDTPRIPIRSVPMGFVHIRGKAETAQLLNSPISHTPCCFYRVEIDQWKSQGKSHDWKCICVDANGYRFHLVDDTGKVLIDAHSAEYDLPLGASKIVDSSTKSPMPDHTALLQYVTAAQQHSMTEHIGQWADKRFQNAQSDNPDVQAKRDALHDLIAGFSAMQSGQGALGGKLPIEAMQKLVASTGPLNDPQKEQKRQMMLQNLQLAEAANQGGLLAQFMPFANVASGRYRLREYVVTPGQEYLISGSCVENADSATSAEDRAMIAKGTNEPTFVISTKTDAQLHHALEKRSLLMIFGGAALAIACAVGLLFRFGLF